MPYKTSGCLVIFEDGVIELEICRAEAYRTANNIAAALNDAVKWREHQARVNAEQPKRYRGPLIVENPDMERDAERYRWLEEHTSATGLTRFICVNGCQLLGEAVDKAMSTNTYTVPVF